ncbi:MAG: diaminopropionate ammonia-lyase [Pseudomonadota bacterium]
MGVNAAPVAPRFSTPTHVTNTDVERGPWSRSLDLVLSADDLRTARAAIREWQDHAPTPTRSLAGLAARSGVARIDYKDESVRFSLKSFKALGGAYAVDRLLARLAVDPREVTVTCATDGNHGRSVAWGAKRAGCRCVIYVHETVSEGRKAAIEAFGAEVRRTDGTYDDSVRRAAADADARGWHVVSDTSYPGYTEVPRDVMAGYMVMADEALDSVAVPSTHIVVQGGVGGAAAAVLATSWLRYGEARPRFVVVEPDRAACIAASLRAGKPTTIDGSLDTVMAGLACGEVSLLAWELLRRGCHDALIIDDEAAVAVMRDLADPLAGDPPIVAGESATCGLAGVLAALERPALARSLGLTPASRVLVFGTEGDTDPDVYTQLVGRPASVVLEGCR